jgi:hypothetical protein
VTSWWAAGAVAHDQQHAAPSSSDVTQKSCGAREAAHAVIALACRLHGRKRGFHAAAEVLGRSDRWVHGFHYHDEGATPDTDTVFAALMTMRRGRAAQLREELAAMEAEDIAIDMVARARAVGGICG